MTEGDEVGDTIADALDLVLVRTIDDAIKLARVRLQGETEAVIANTAERIYRRALAFHERHLA